MSLYGKTFFTFRTTYVITYLRSGHFYDLAKYNCARQGLFRFISQISMFCCYYSLCYSQTKEMILQNMWLQHTLIYCKFFIFTSDSNTSDLLVLLLQRIVHIIPATAEAFRLSCNDIFYCLLTEFLVLRYLPS